MVVYCNSPNEYKTVWFCKMCLTAVLSVSAVSVHLAKCKEASKWPVPAKKDEDLRYICEFFSSKVALKKHIEQHENALSGFNGETIATEEYSELQDNKA